jgi:hypothetical protein
MTMADEPHGVCIGVHVEQGIRITIEPGRQDHSRRPQDDLPSTIRSWLNGHDVI